jgi:hypothetical protein
MLTPSVGGGKCKRSFEEIAVRQMSGFSLVADVTIVSESCSVAESLLLALPA